MYTKEDAMFDAEQMGVDLYPGLCRYCGKPKIKCRAHCTCEECSECGDFKGVGGSCDCEETKSVEEKQLELKEMRDELYAELDTLADQDLDDTSIQEYIEREIESLQFEIDEMDTQLARPEKVGPKV